MLCCTSCRGLGGYGCAYETEERRKVIITRLRMLISSEHVLTSTTSEDIAAALKVSFARNGIPKILGSDNGPQYANKTIKQLAERYGLRLVKSSPHYPQGNGLA